VNSTFEESGWRFDFDADHWTAVVKWDEDETYTKALQVLRGRTRREIAGCGHPNCRWSGGRHTCEIAESTRAVDFAAEGPGPRPYLIEVKRLAGPGPFESVDERAFKIAAKVRDSLAGVAFARAGTGHIPAPDLAAVRRRFRLSSNSVRVLVVFEHPGSPAQVLALRLRLMPLLAWIRGEVAVVDSAAPIPGLTITLAP
jgi:hypothetical protein